MDAINLTVKFINDTTNGSGAVAQTGDFPLWIIGIIAAILCAAVFCILKNKKKIAAKLCVIAVFAMVLCAIPAFGQNSSLTPDKTTLNAKFVDGKVTVEKCVLTNNSDTFYDASSINIKYADETFKFDNLKVSVKGFNNVLYEGSIDGLDHAISKSDSLEPNKSTNLEIGFEGLNANDVEKLYNKDFLKIAFTPTNKPAYKLTYDKGKTPFDVAITGDVPLDKNFYKEGGQATILDQGKLAHNSLAFQGWSTNKDTDTPEYKAGDKIVINKDTTLYAIWKVKYLAHRGCQTWGPENSIASFEASRDRHTFAIETDFRISSDNVVYCIHDATLNRTIVNEDGTQATGSVSHYSSDEINKMHVGHVNSPKKDFEAKYNYEELVAAGKTKIPTMDDYFRICKEGGCVAFAELKEDNGIIDQMIACIKKYGLEDQVMISSSNFELLQAYRDKGGKAFCHKISGNPENDQITDTLKLAPSGIAFDYPDLTVNPIKAINYRGTGLMIDNLQDLVNQTHKDGLQLCFRAVDTQVQLQKALELGIDYVPTNSLW